MSIILNSLSDSKLVESINDGGVGILPTDTLYGIVCSAHIETAVRRLYQIKQRSEKPGTIIAAHIDDLIGLGIKERYLKAVSGYWPNAISVVIPAIDTKLEYLHQGKMSIACRVVKAPKDLLNLLSITGPLVTSSANITGEQPATTIREAQNYFGSLVDFYVDGGHIVDAPASTVLRVIDDAVEVIRDGAVKIDEETGRVL